MIESLLLWAEQPAAGAGGGSANFLVGMLPFLPVVIFFYLFLIRPQQKQERVRRQMLDALKKNDKVVTQGGIIGTVTSIDSGGQKIVLKVDDDKGVKLTFAKAYIVRVLTPETDKGAEEADVPATVGGEKK